MSEAKALGTVGILVGGGPAPGINGVIEAATRTAIRRGARVIGVFEGFRWLMRGKDGIEHHARELGLDDVAGIHLRGGSLLQTSRANPTRDPADLERCVAALDALGIEDLVTIGGDDTAHSAIEVSKQAGGRMRVVHVPKTIDNDLPLPEGVPTFGYETARDQAALLVAGLQEDGRTMGRWFFCELMGRQAGFLSHGTGVAAGATVTVIAEEFAHDPIAVDDVVRVVEGSIVKRRAQGRNDGCAVIAEGIAERLDPQDELLRGVGRDEHGHIKLADVPLAKVVAARVRSNLRERGIEIAINAKEIGYELRCLPPCAFDREYTRTLGVGAIDMLARGESRVLVTRQGYRCVPIPFEELVDPGTGRTRVRYVDVGSDAYRHARSLQVRVEAEDIDDPQRLARIAEAAGLDPDAARERYAPRG